MRLTFNFDITLSTISLEHPIRVKPVVTREIDAAQAERIRNLARAGDIKLPPLPKLVLFDRHGTPKTGTFAACNPVARVTRSGYRGAFIVVRKRTYCERHG